MRVASRRGFTLIEVLIAVAILTIGLTAIFLLQFGGVRAGAKAKQMTTIAMLAKSAMVDAEFAFEGKPFSELKKEETGKFERPFEEYSWKREIKEVEFPNINPVTAETKDDSQKTQEAEYFSKLVTNYLSKSLREVIVTITWQEKGKELTYSIAQYWVDLNNDFQLQD